MKVNTLKEMGIWKIFERHNNENVMYTKLVLKIKRDEKKVGCYHNDCLVVCVNEDVDCQEEICSPVDDYFVIKLIIFVHPMGMDGAAH